MNADLIMSGREFLCANNAGKTCVEITELVNSTFGTEYTVGQIKAIRSRMHIKSGLTGYFEKGHVPANKGRKGFYSKGSEKGWFKKGHVPYNKAHVGDEAWTCISLPAHKLAHEHCGRIQDSAEKNRVRYRA